MAELVTSAEFEDAGWLSVARVERRAPGLELLLDFRIDTEPSGRQAWTLACAELRACRLGVEPVYDVQLLADHILLAPYADAHVVLGMRGPAPDPRRAVADLWQKHWELAADWFPLTAFLNPNLPLAALLGTSGAIVAEGPRRLIEAYSDALRAHVEPYVVEERAPVRWMEGRWVPERQDVQLLLLGPSDYVIGSGFSARREPVEILPPVA